MFDVESLRKAVMQDKTGSAKASKAECWRLVPVGYLVECVEERASVFQYDEGMGRTEAEKKAVEHAGGCFRVYKLIEEA